MGALERLHERYRKQVAFLVVYVKEAHPEDGWVLTENREDSIAIADPTSFAGRAEVARACATRLAIRMPVVIDDIGNVVTSNYGGWPDRLYLVGKDGRIAYQGGEGPMGFRPAELERAIEAELASKRGARGQL